MKIQPRIASGFPEYLPEDQIEFNRLLDIIRKTYERYGFAPIDTPDLELREVLLAKGGGETDQQVYELTRGKNDFCLRFDLTVPLARYVAQHQGDLVFPFKRYHIGKVHRAERAQAGRAREFYQCDIDTIGSASPIIDAEFPAVINDIFEQFDFGEFVIRLNDRRILNGFFESIGLSEHKTEIMRLVDKIEKMSEPEFVLLLEENGLDKSQIERLVEFTNINGTNDEILDKLRSLQIDNANFSAGLTNIESLVSAIRAFSVPERRFQIDLKIARGLDYYTGTVYETVLVDYPEVGSVCSGGRYDDLTGYYTDSQLPGIGISIGLTRLFYQLRESGIIKPTRKSPADVVILPMSEQEHHFAIAAAQVLRESNVNNVLYTEPNQFKKKLRYADQMGFRYALIIGSDEAATSSVTIKDMTSGESHLVELEQLAEFFS